MKAFVRNAERKDYEAVVNIMGQVQEMHVKWRPDIYKTNKEMIPADKFAGLLKEGTFFVAEADGMVVGVMAVSYTHLDVYKRQPVTVPLQIWERTWEAVL